MEKGHFEEILEKGHLYLHAEVWFQPNFSMGRKFVSSISITLGAFGEIKLP